MNTDHKCPAPNCNIMVPVEQLACRGHWFSIPVDLRNRVWSTYRREPGSEDHKRAVSDAIAFLRSNATQTRQQQNSDKQAPRVRHDTPR